jgi:hypothetical protein
MSSSIRRLVLPVIGVLALAAAGCGGGGPSGLASASPGAGQGGGAPGSTAFSVSGGVSGQLSIASSDCRKGSGQDTPTQFNFTGSVGGQDYLVSIGGFAMATGSYDLTTQTVVGVSVESNPSGTGSAPSLFWAAPLRSPNPAASGTVTTTVTDAGGSGQLDAQLVQEAFGVATPGGSTVHLTGTWSCTVN